DRKRFRQALMDGTIPKDSRLGGLIEIHGRGGRRRDWTNGCVALSDDGMDFLVRRVRPGTPVTIVGSLERHTELVDGRPAPGKTAR
ncbi:MAG: L,D-transpeptidase family protein, partial [Acidobacteriota bacterium]